MIEKRTVLILGAGSSAEYGFPVGYKLYQRICGGKCVAPPLPPRKEEIEAYVEGRNYEFNNFRTELNQSSQLSVDAFLETRPELLDIGKRAIACGLIPFEDEASLLPTSKGADNGPRWYQLLLAELGNDIEMFSKNRLSVLTFNYDRSLEHFLVVALSKKYNIRRSEAWLHVQNIPILHLYGSLGEYNTDNFKGRPYESQINYDSVQDCVDSIRILREGEMQDKIFASAHKILREAEVVVILGFGFDDTNLERLKINMVPASSQVYASAFGMTKRGCDQAAGIIGRDIEFGTELQGNTQFLRSHVTFE